MSGRKGSTVPIVAAERIRIVFAGPLHFTALLQFRHQNLHRAPAILLVDAEEPPRREPHLTRLVTRAQPLLAQRRLRQPARAAGRRRECADAREPRDGTLAAARAVSIGGSYRAAGVGEFARTKEIGPDLGRCRPSRLDAESNHAGDGRCGPSVRRLPRRAAFEPFPWATGRAALGKEAARHRATCGTRRRRFSIAGSGFSIASESFFSLLNRSGGAGL